MFLPPRNATADLEALGALRDEAPGLKAFSVASNFALLAAAGVFYSYREPLGSVLLTLATFVSLGYHACAEYGYCMGFALEWMQKFDHVTAGLIVMAIYSIYIVLHDLDLKPLATRLDEADQLGADDAEIYQRLAAADTRDVNMADPDEGDIGGPHGIPLYQLHFAKFWPVFVAIPASFATFYWPAGDMTPMYMIVVLCTIAYLVYGVMFRLERRIFTTSGNFLVAPLAVHLPLFILAILFGAGAVGCFVAPNDTTSLFHSFWHIFASAALICFLLAKEKRPMGGLFAIEMVDDPDEEEEEEKHDLPREAVESSTELTAFSKAFVSPF